jgi:hypothetical protein
MGFILRTENDVNNPTLPGGVYGKYITIGRPVYYKYDGSRTRYIIFISDGGLYGLDSIDTVEYGGGVLDPADWIFHPGTLTKQISPYPVSAIDTTGGVLTVNLNPYTDGNLVRLSSLDGQLPSTLSPDLRYQISDKTTNTVRLKDEAGSAYISFPSAGTGSIRIWKADAGFDDPVQGLPTFCPEVASTFNNIAYIEGKLLAGASDPVEQPNWDDFRITGTGRKLMLYDSAGNETGLGTGDDLSNVANIILDNYLVSYQGKPSRIHWPSFDLLNHAADTLILQTADPEDEEVATPSFTGRYYYNFDFTNLVFTRLDPNINFDWGTSTSPAPGMPTQNYSVRWTGKIKPAYSEVYTFTAHFDDACKIYIDGNLILDHSSLGTFTATYAMEADRLYDFQVDFQDIVFSSYIDVKWQSASQALQLVPPSIELGTADTEVRRYECHTAFPVPVEASEVHERLMERVPGWDWTDDGGLITMLPPNRPIVFAFDVDRESDDAVSTVVKQTFQKKRIPIASRPNFLLFRYRNVQRTGYPFKYVQADREDLRRFTNGEPTNFPASDLGVSTRSLAERMAEYQMVLKSDPKYNTSISGARASSKIRKNQLVTVSYIDNGGRVVDDEQYLVSLHSWGGTDGRNDFNLIPVKSPLYTDESLVIFNPVDIPAMWAVLEPDAYSLADGANVTTDWQDKTTGNHDAVVGGTPQYIANQINGRGVIRMSADSADQFALPSMAAFTKGAFFIVMKVINVTTSGGNKLGASGAASHYPYYLDGKIYEDFGSTARVGPLDPVVPILDTWHVYWGYSDAGVYKLYQNESLLYESSVNTVGFPAAPLIGSNGFFNSQMDLAGVYLMNDVPTSLEIGNILSYLKARNGNFY